MKFTPTPFNDDGRLKRDDWWNVVQFILISLAMGYLFNYFILEPKQQELKAAQIAQQDRLGQKPVDPVLPARPRDEVLKQSQRVSLSNGDVELSIDLTRGNIDDLSLKKYFTTIENKERVSLLSPAGSMYPLYTETGWITDSKDQVMPDKNTVWHVVARDGDRSLTIGWNNGRGLSFARNFTLDDQYLVTVKDMVSNSGATTAHVWPYALVSQHGLPQELSGGIVHEGAIGYVGDSFIEIGYGKWAKLAAKPEAFASPAGWLGITSRYFFVGLIPDQKQEVSYRVTYAPPLDPTDKNNKAHYQVDAQGKDHTVAAGGTAEFSTRIFMGPKKLRMLAAYGEKMELKHFDLVVDYGWFYFLTKPFYYVLVFINGLVGNFGVAILCLTLLIKLAVFPLAQTSFRSFAKMKLVGPQIQALQKTYAHDKKKMQEELVELYQKEKVNPLSGCLPILAQIPIFFAVYKVINVSIEMRHAPFFGWIRDLSAPDPTSLLNLYGLLSYPVPMWAHFGIWPTVLFVMIMIQVRLSPPQPDKMMHIFFNYYYPVLVCYMMAQFAAGLVIYWAFSAFCAIAQQIFIMRSLGVPIHLLDNMPWAKKKPEAEALAAVAMGEVIEVAEAAEAIEPTPEPDLPDQVRPKNKKK